MATNGLDRESHEVGRGSGAVHVVSLTDREGALRRLADGYGATFDRTGLDHPQDWSTMARTRLDVRET
jgi:hypothetical protein